MEIEGQVYDVIVVGAGIIGSATAYHLAKMGKRTILLEQVWLHFFILSCVTFFIRDINVQLIYTDSDISRSNILFADSLTYLHRFYKFTKHIYYSRYLPSVVHISTRMLLLRWCEGGDSNVREYVRVNIALFIISSVCHFHLFISYSLFFCFRGMPSRFFFNITK